MGRAPPGSAGVPPAPVRAQPGITPPPRSTRNAASVLLPPARPLKNLTGALCRLGAGWRETGSMSSTDRFLIHMDAQDAQDFFRRPLAWFPGHPQIRTRSSPKSAFRAAASRPDDPVHPCSIDSPSRWTGSVAGGTPALPGGLYPMASSHPRKSIGLRVHSCPLVVRLYWRSGVSPSNDPPGGAGASLI